MLVEISRGVKVIITKLGPLGRRHGGLVDAAFGVRAAESHPSPGRPGLASLQKLPLTFKPGDDCQLHYSAIIGSSRAGGWQRPSLPLRTGVTGIAFSARSLQLQPVQNQQLFS
jgi:hypothetical protein